MQIVIDINDEVLERINNSDSNDFDGWIESDLIQLIQDGTPLPKNHGRLIDAEELVRQSCVQFYTTNYFGHITKMIDEAPTVLEAESEE